MDHANEDDQVHDVEEIDSSRCACCADPMTEARRVLEELEKERHTAGEDGPCSDMQRALA